MNRGGEPLSPELALVDPALAEAARRGLPNPNGTDRAADLLETPSRPRLDNSPPASAPSAVQPDPASTGASSPSGPDKVSAPSRVRPPKRNKSRVGWTVALLALLGVGAWIGISQVGGGGSSEISAAKQVSARKQVTSRKRESSVRHATTKRSSAANQGKPRATTTGKKSGRGRVRTFGWIREPKASFYAIQFSRGGRRILQARTTEPRLVVPASWTYRGRRFSFEPGRYTWVVRPGFRSSGRVRYGAPIVRAKLVL